MLHFKNPSVAIFVPDQRDPEAALERTTHLCVGAHQDDQEFMAYHGIAACYGRKDLWFSGVTVTDGAGSSRTGLYGTTSDAEMMLIRKQEQNKAAFVGDYAIQIQLGYASRMVKDAGCLDPIDDLELLFRVACPEVLYLHNPADKHDTHVAVFLRCISALRRLPMDRRPAKVYGCEIWRSLDWLVDNEKVALDTGARPNLAAALDGVFDSQIAGGKRYDLGVAGRRMANATFFESHAVDATSSLAWAMDLVPLIRDDSLDPVTYALGFVDRLRDDVEARLRCFGC
ncbi:MAG: PIG-L deacetylase family protein [Kiritimatiellia bacterium]